MPWKQTLATSNMADVAGNRMNLAALQRRDPFITDIVDTASQVALYTFSAKSNEWERTDVEGTLFVYTRSAAPVNGFMILNRLGLNDLIEPINRNLEFQLQDPFLLYRNAQAVIQGIWFYDKDECARIGQLMNSLVQVAIGNLQEKKSGNLGPRQRRASESDSMFEKAELGAMSGNPKRNVDIMQMLSKAQDEYDKGKRPGPGQRGKSSPAMNGEGHPVKQGKGRSRKAEPKPMIDNPNAAATRSSVLPKPTAVKVNLSEQPVVDGAAAAVLEPDTPGTQISLAALFQNVSSLQDVRSRDVPEDSSGAIAPSVPVTAPMPSASSSSSGSGAQMHPMLKRIMSNPANTLEEIERKQRGETTIEVHARVGIPGVVAQSRVQGGALLRNGHGFNQDQQLLHHYAEPDSPNTALKRTLNILPPTPNKIIAPSQSEPVINMLPDPSLLSSLIAPSTPGGSTVSSTSQSSGVMFSLGDSSDSAGSHSQGAAASTRGLVPSALFPTKKPTVVDATPGKPYRSGSTDDLPVQSTGGATTLITPQDLLQGANAANKQQPGSSQLGQQSSILLSPMVFQVGSSSRLTPPIAAQSSLGVPSLQQPLAMSEASSTHSSSPQQEAPPAEPQSITPLTREQLKQSLIYLLRNDGAFLGAVHEAYVRSLHDELALKLEKL